MRTVLLVRLRGLSRTSVRLARLSGLIVRMPLLGDGAHLLLVLRMVLLLLVRVGLGTHGLYRRLAWLSRANLWLAGL